MHGCLRNGASVEQLGLGDLICRTEIERRCAGGGGARPLLLSEQHERLVAQARHLALHTRRRRGRDRAPHAPRTRPARAPHAHVFGKIQMICDDKGSAIRWLALRPQLQNVFGWPGYAVKTTVGI
eukprot:6200800-Pleurochrysis_carterae.AAC.2